MGQRRAGGGRVTEAGFPSVTVMTALWGAWPSGHDASGVAGEPAAPSPPSGGRGLLQSAAVSGRARRPAADVQCLSARMTAMSSALRRGSGDTDRWVLWRDLAGSADTRHARGVKTFWPASPHAQPSRCGEPSPVPGLSREGMAAGPGRKRPCNGWPWAGGSPDMRWVFRHPPARYLRSGRIRVHYLAASGLPHARAAVRPPECLHARSEALDLGSAP
jgi:hypothetical protein